MALSVWKASQENARRCKRGRRWPAAVIAFAFSLLAQCDSATAERTRTNSNCLKDSSLTRIIALALIFTSDLQTVRNTRRVVGHGVPNVFRALLPNPRGVRRPIFIVEELVDAFNGTCSCSSRSSCFATKCDDSKHHKI